MPLGLSPFLRWGGTATLSAGAGIPFHVVTPLFPRGWKCCFPPWVSGIVLWLVVVCHAAGSDRAEAKLLISLHLIEQLDGRELEFGSRTCILCLGHLLAPLCPLVPAGLQLGGGR